MKFLQSNCKSHQSPHLLPTRILRQPNVLFDNEHFHLLFSLFWIFIHMLLDSHYVEALPTTKRAFRWLNIEIDIPHMRWGIIQENTRNWFEIEFVMIKMSKKWKGFASKNLKKWIFGFSVEQFLDRRDFMSIRQITFESEYNSWKCKISK